MNYFDQKTAAERYAKGRPDFHCNTIKHIKDFLQPERKLDEALDIACGTGLSTKALLEIATHVYGTDSSKAMIDCALQDDAIDYRIAKATEQPFPDNSFDLITVCSGIHWFDIDKFLTEAHRLLKRKSWLIIYDNFFIAEMEGNTAFKSWYQNVYLNAFPAPARNDTYNWTNAQLKNFNFDFKKEEQFNNAVSFNKNDLVLYFTTQSNIIAVVENNEITYEEAQTWLQKELSQFFQYEIEEKIIHFGNWIKYLQTECNEY